MVSWSALVAAEPDFAARVRRLFDARKHKTLATLRQDGSPRISGIEAQFTDDELWLGMMPGSRKAEDLLRDPRFALHCATTDKQVAAGDAKLSGCAVPVEDDAEKARYSRAFQTHTGYEPGAGPFALFRADVLELSMLKPAGDHLDIAWWRPGGPVQRIERR
jgi:hypothetical protein